MLHIFGTFVLCVHNLICSEMRILLSVGDLYARQSSSDAKNIDSRQPKFVGQQIGNSLTYEDTSQDKRKKPNRKSIPFMPGLTHS